MPQEQTKPVLLSAIVKRDETVASADVTGQLLSFAKALEDAGFDIAFMADFIANNVTADGRVEQSLPSTVATLDPVVLAAVLGQALRRIGLVTTVNTNFSYPYAVARQLASLEQITGGRVGWNVVSSFSASAAGAFGLVETDKSARYRRAAEYVQLVQALFRARSDADGGVSAAQAVEVAGEYLSSRSALDVPVADRRGPVIFQAGMSGEGVAFSARHADVVYSSAATPALAREHLAELGRAAAATGRAMRPKVIRGVYPYLGDTEAEANARFDAAMRTHDVHDDRRLRDRYYRLFGVDLSAVDLDDPVVDPGLQANVNAGRWQTLADISASEGRSLRDLYRDHVIHRGHLALVGTGQAVAATLQQWVDDGLADGFNVNVDTVREVREFGAQVVPHLYRRGDGPTAGSLREILSIT